MKMMILDSIKSGAQVFIALVGIADVGIMSATLLGMDTFLKFDPPTAAWNLFPIESLRFWWFSVHFTACSLLWIASMTLSTLAFTNLDTFRNQAFLPWLFTSIFVLFLSLLGNGLTHELSNWMICVSIRVTCITVVWLGMERWDWDLFQLDLDLGDDEEEEEENPNAYPSPPLGAHDLVETEEEEDEDDEEDTEED